jgi:hypothetical protein
MKLRLCPKDLDWDETSVAPEPVGHLEIRRGPNES